MFGFLWILLFGKGGDITPAPVTLPVGGQVFYLAPMPLKPVDDTMLVTVQLKGVTDEQKKAMLAGARAFDDFGAVKVEICTTETECIPMPSSNLMYLSDFHGMSFLISDPHIKRSRFIGVKVGVDRAMGPVTIRWANYTQ